MVDIVVIYHSRDRMSAERLSEAFAEAGLDVAAFDESDLPAGVSAATHDARAAVALWSPHAVVNEASIDAASRALALGKLHAAALLGARPPAMFNALAVRGLASGADGAARASDVAELAREVCARIGHEPANLRKSGLLSLFGLGARKRAPAGASAGGSSVVNVVVRNQPRSMRIDHGSSEWGAEATPDEAPPVAPAAVAPPPVAPRAAAPPAREPDPYAPAPARAAAPVAAAAPRREAPPPREENDRRPMIYVGAGLAVAAAVVAVVMVMNGRDTQSVPASNPREDVRADAGAPPALPAPTLPPEALAPEDEPVPTEVAAVAQPRRTTPTTPAPPPTMSDALPPAPEEAAFYPPNTLRGAYEAARNTNTVAAYNAFLAAYPAGELPDAARRARARLLEFRAQRQLDAIEQPVRLYVERARRAATRAALAAAAARAETARHASVELPGGRYYQGEWSRDGANGYGVADARTGEQFSGTWDSSRWNGYGVLNYANGFRYEGEFHRGVPTGHGAFWDANGERLQAGAVFTQLSP